MEPLSLSLHRFKVTTNSVSRRCGGINSKGSSSMFWESSCLHSTGQLFSFFKSSSLGNVVLYSTEMRSSSSSRQGCTPASRFDTLASEIPADYARSCCWSLWITMKTRIFVLAFSMMRSTCFSVGNGVKAFCSFVLGILLFSFLDHDDPVLDGVQAQLLGIKGVVSAEGVVPWVDGIEPAVLVVSQFQAVLVSPVHLVNVLLDVYPCHYFHLISICSRRKPTAKNTIQGVCSRRKSCIHIETSPFTDFLRA